MADEDRLGEFCRCLREALAPGPDGPGKIIDSACPPAPAAERHIVTPVEPVGKCEYLLTGDEAVDRELREFLHGRAKARPDVRVADYLKRDNVLRPSLEGELDRLRTILEKETPGQPGGILINYVKDSRVVEISGYSADPYRGSTWEVRVTPNYTAQNQAEIAEYIRRNEDALVDTVKGLIPRRRHTTVLFFEDHPGVEAARFVPSGKGYLVPEMHREDG